MIVQHLIALYLDELYDKHVSRKYYNSDDLYGEKTTLDDLKISYAVQTLDLSTGKNIDLDEKYVQIRVFQANDPERDLKTSAFTELPGLQKCQEGVDFKNTRNFDKKILDTSLCLDSSSNMLFYSKNREE